MKKNSTYTVSVTVEGPDGAYTKKIDLMACSVGMDSYANVVARERWANCLPATDDPSDAWEFARDQHVNWRSIRKRYGDKAAEKYRFGAVRNGNSMVVPPSSYRVRLSRVADTLGEDITRYLTGVLLHRKVLRT